MNLPEVGLRWLALVLLAAAWRGRRLLVVVLRLPARSSDRRSRSGGGSSGSRRSPARRPLQRRPVLLQVRGGRQARPVALASAFGTAWALDGAVLGSSASSWPGHARPSCRRAEPGGALTASLLIGLAGVPALTGLVATGPDQEPPFRWIALTVHRGRRGVGRRAGRARDRVGPLLRGPASIGLARAVLRRFWLVALPAVAGLAVTGLYLSGQLVASADASS